MGLAPVYADVEGAVVAWATGLAPHLVGTGNPVAAGFHLAEVRSPSEGAVAYLEVVDRSGDDVADSCRVSAVFVSRRRGPAEIAARAYGNALDKLTTYTPTVTTGRGDRVKIYGAGDVAGPTFTGDFGGEVAYRVDATFIVQPV